MPHRWPWIERHFTFDYPVEKFPDCYERLAGTAPRLSFMLAAVSDEEGARSDGDGWTIKQNVGHLTDLEYLPETRIDEILEGRETLTAADMANVATHEATHNQRPLADLLSEFSVRREALCDRLASLPASDWGRASFHGRIQKPMRLVDLVYFTAEHDDYHLSRIRALLRWLRGEH
ncbi:MAG: DinB family protein [Phycisphaerae bacterium]